MIYIQIYQINFQGSTRLPKGFTNKLEGSKCSLNGLGSHTRDNGPTTIKLQPQLLHTTVSFVYWYHCCSNCPLLLLLLQLSTVATAATTATIPCHSCSSSYCCYSLLLFHLLLHVLCSQGHCYAR